MKRAALFLAAFAGCFGSVSAESPVTVTLGPASAGAAIRPDFIGLSFGMKALLPNAAGAHFFSATNHDLVTLFRNLGLRHLRVGGTTVESPPATPIPDTRDIDSLFGFARAAQVDKVIYSFRLLEAEPGLHHQETNAFLARYIWEHYRNCLDYFAIGNEPDRRKVYDQDLTITNFSTYLAKWQEFAAAIRKAVPEARFAGPDGGSGNISWTTRFAAAGKDSSLLALVTEHFYVGGAGRGLGAAEAIEASLSPGWVAANERLYDKMAKPVLALRLPYRFTEANDHYSGGVRDASDTFAGALWALDFLHWWAAHGAAGVDFHNTQWVANDVITHDSEGRLTITPKGYGFRAFALGSQGFSERVTIENPDGLSIAAYAVQGQDEHWVTLINKTHGSGARAAKVTVIVPEPVKQAAELSLSVRSGEASSKTGVTLGGAAIRADEPWSGKWQPLELGKSGPLVVTVPAVSAMILKLTRK